MIFGGLPSGKRLLKNGLSESTTYGISLKGDGNDKGIASGFFR
jgi:hypothetical protein